MRSSRMMSSLTATPPASPSGTTLLQIPGGYGWPILGPLRDRLDYSWFQGSDKFFKKRIEIYNSRVFRTNLPPTFPWFLNVNPNVIAVLDVKSFSHLFDMEIVEKDNILVGDFAPSVDYTGGLRVCAYLDTADPKHTQIKNFALHILKQSASSWVPSMVTSVDSLWNSLELQLAGTNKGVSYQIPMVKFLFTFLTRALTRADPAAVPDIAKNGYILIAVWLALQLIPSINITRFQPLVEIFFHSFRYPFWLVKSTYRKLTNFIQTQAKEVISQGQNEFNLTKEEAIHNLLFILGFNAFGGFALFFTSLMAALGNNKGVHENLRNEVRETLAKNDGALSIGSVQQMELVYSFVYETLRLNPPVPMQYAKARKDFDLTSNDGVFAIKKGELLCGYQPLVMRDSTVFENPDDFVYDRFTEEKGGRELLKYLYWSNGPQSGGAGPSASNKQCPGRDVVPLTAALFLADLFRRYDDIVISNGSITALQKAKIIHSNEWITQKSMLR